MYNIWFWLDTSAQNNGFNALSNWYMSYWCVWSTYFYLGDYFIIYFIWLISQLLKDSYNHVFPLYLCRYINFYETSLSVQQSLFWTCLRAISTYFFPVMLLFFGSFGINIVACYYLWAIDLGRGLRRKLGILAYLDIFI